jgi:methyl coenzyme M reductase subunit C
LQFFSQSIPTAAVVQRTTLMMVRPTDFKMFKMHKMKILQRLLIARLPDEEAAQVEGECEWQ